MATHSDTDDEETFVTFGTALEILDDDEPLKKPVQLGDVQATDSKGRPRFHGAFTGGFSAGFFNTVGSKEGWTPSTFVSSREKRPEAKHEQRPEDFMDEEDIGEYGIAPRKYVTGSQFTSEERKKRQLDEVRKVTADSVLAGQSALLDLIVPERVTIGVKLLRKMGWKEGQGLGPRLSKRQKKKANQRVYGCALPPSPDSDEGLDDESILSDVTFAPQDAAHILLSSKDNTKGLGYRGLDPSKALPSSRINLFEPPRITKGGNRRKGIRGQAFGVGALEDDDDDIYAMDSMSNYDMTMGGEDDDKFGWTGRSGKRQEKTPVDYVGRVLEGFTLSAQKLVQKKDFPPPKLPRDFRPVHSFREKEELQGFTILSTQSKEGVDYRQFLKPTDGAHEAGSQSLTPGYHGDTAGTNFKPDDERNRYKDASARSLALGEKPFVGSVFDLISRESKDRMEQAKQGTSTETDQSTEKGTNTNAMPGASTVTEQGAKTVPMQGTSSPSAALIPATETAPQNTSEPASIDQQIPQNVPLFQGGFKPFHKNPAKQQRYDKYLDLAKLGHKDPYSLIVTSDMTEWEIEHEKEEFHQAYKLYRPLAGMMAMRFTRGGNVDDEDKTDVRMPESIDTSDAGKAAAMKMYGKLTREVLEWHPDKLVCKRFNVPNPYPGSTIVGLATVKRDKYSVFNFLNFANPTQSEQDMTEANVQPETNKFESVEMSQPDSRVSKELNKGKAMKSIFSHLVGGDKDAQKSVKPVSFTVKSVKPDKPKEFKSIFSHLESEENSVKPSTNVATETEHSEKDNIQKTKKPDARDRGSLTELSRKKEGEPAIDLFRAIFRNTDSEDSSSSEEEETAVANDSSNKTEGSSPRVKADVEEKMDTNDAEDIDDKMAGNKEVAPGILPGNGEPMETLSERLSPQVESEDSDTFGPALPPGPSTGEGSAQAKSSNNIDGTKHTVSLEYIDLTKRSSRKHQHKDKHKHKSKKDKKEKHKKSKHKKKNKKKEKKKNTYASDSSEADTTDKDTEEDSDDERATDREILNKLKAIRAGKRI